MSNTKGSAAKIRLASLDELLGTGSGSGGYTQKKDQIVRLPLSVMHAPKNHPFRVLDDEKMAETVESVKKYGVLHPGIVREDQNMPGTYEIISGNRRHYASELAGYTDMPVVIRDLTDDEAIVIMVDANIQRDDMLPSERAQAYRMKYDALKRMGAADGVRSDEKLAKQAGESRNTIQRYIRITYLIPELLHMVDEKRLPVITAVELSYLTADEQFMLYGVMQEKRVIPSGDQAVRLKEYSRSGNLTETVIQILLEKEENFGKISLKEREIRKYFPDGYTGKQISDVIFDLLADWKKKHLV